MLYHHFTIIICLYNFYCPYISIFLYFHILKTQVEPRVNKMELYSGLELPKYTAKLKALFKLLIKIKDSADNNEVITRFEGVNELFAPQSTGIAMDQIIPFKFIIFVKEVASTYPLTYLINNFFEHKYDLEGRTICLPVSGVGSMSDATR